MPQLMDKTCHPAFPPRQSVLRRTSCEVWLVGSPAEGGEAARVLKTVASDGDDLADRALRREIDWHVRAAGVSRGIVPVLDVLEDAGGGHPGVLLPYLPGGSLEDAFAGAPSADAAEVIHGLVSLALTLGELHDAGIVHGDVAPGNVLREDVGAVASLAAPGPVLLCDFGSAGPSGVGTFGTDLPAASLLIMATHGFAAPEVEAGQAPTPASDAFGLGALGLIWIDQVTRSCRRGSPDAETTVAAGREVIDADRRSGGDLEVVAEWCRRLMADDPEARPRDLRAAAHDLEGATNGRHRAPRTVEFGPRPPRAVPVTLDRRVGASRRGAVVLAMILVAMFAWLARPHRGQSNAPRVAPVLHTVPARSTSCPQSGAAGEVAQTRPRLADVLGTGCAQRVMWVPGVLTVRSSGRSDVAVRFGVGKLGDVVFVGRWECAPRATPRIYRPSTGEVIGYPGVPGASGVAAAVQPWRRRTGIVDGRVVVQRDAHGCDRLRVG